MSLGKAGSELLRGLEMARIGGLAAGWRFVREEVLRNTWLRTTAGLGSSSRDSVECNVCGWRGRRFLSNCAVGYVDRNSFCPRCRSYARHRGFAWLWRARLGAELAGLRERQGLKIVFAPEPGMLQILEPVLGALAGVDLRPGPLVAHQEDLQRLGFADGSVDFASCFHVLEHVPDDRRALGELRRVLSQEGRLILCVPITFGRTETWDFGGPNPALNMHCFDYGEDFPRRLEEAGFSGSSYRIDLLVPPDLHRRLAMTTEQIFVLRRAERAAESVIEPVERV